MNSVHKQCPNNDSETVLSQKLVKCIVCTHTAQPARPGARRHSQVCAGTPRRAQCRVVAAQPVVSERQVAVWRVPARYVSRHAPPVPRAQRPRAQRPNSQRPSAQRPAPSAQRLHAPPNAQMGNSPFQCLHHFFYPFFPAIGKCPKILYSSIFFSFSSTP